MNDKHTNSGDNAIDETLVAYLDGELSADDRQRVERRLSTDADYRQQLNQLQLSWDLLDALSRAETDQELTRSTIAMVARDQRESSTDRRVASPVRRRLPSHWLAVAAAAVLGFVAISLPMRVRNQRQLRDLPIAKNLELYRYADGVEFLERLQAEGIFAEEESHDL